MRAVPSGGVQFVYRAACEVLGTAVSCLTRLGYDERPFESELGVSQQLVLESLVTASTDQAIPQHVLEYVAILAVLGDLPELRNERIDRFSRLLHSGVKRASLHDERRCRLLVFLHEGDKFSKSFVRRLFW